MYCAKKPSPNFDERPLHTEITFIVIHYTDLTSCEEALDILCDPQKKVSSHYVIHEEGMIYQLVDEQKRAWHAGVSHWRGYDNINNNSIGIELCNKGHSHGYHAFPQAQMESLLKLCLSLKERYPINPFHIVGHSDIAPNRKQDPGELFNWSYLASHNLGLWREEKEDNLQDLKEDYQSVGVLYLEQAKRYLEKIGYLVCADASLESLLKAFQRHFLPQEVTGLLSSRTFKRLQEIAHLYEIYPHHL